MLYGFHWPQRIHSDILSAFHSNKFSDFDVSLLHSCCFLLVAYLMTFAYNIKSIHYMWVLRGLNTIERCMVFIGPNEFIVIFLVHSIPTDSVISIGSGCPLLYLPKRGKKKQFYGTSVCLFIHKTW